MPPQNKFWRKLARQGGTVTSAALSWSHLHAFFPSSRGKIPIITSHLIKSTPSNSAVMASIQLLKSTPSNSHSKFGCFCAEFSLQKRRIRLLNSGIANNYRRFRVICKVEGADKQSNGEEPPESLFMKELRRRGMTPTSLLEEKNRGVEEIKFREEDGGWGYNRRNGTTTGTETNLTDQREISLALNSEGLEGLIPRAKLLLTLGGTFFLAFWPLILATVALFFGLYLYFGTEFIHDGSLTRVAPPPYIDPYELLEDERIYKTAPPLN